MSLTREQVLETLKTLKDPVSAQDQDIVSAGVVRALNVAEDGAVLDFDYREVRVSQAISRPISSIGWVRLRWMSTARAPTMIPVRPPIVKRKMNESE